MARIWYGLVWVLAIAWFLWATDAIAGGSNDDCNGHGNCNDIDVEANYSEGGAGGHGGDGGAATATTGDVSSTGGAADAAATVGDTYAGGGEGGDGTATATLNGGDVSIEGDRVETNNTNVVLVPNNNTSGCLRVWGLAFGNGDGAASLGIPTRDAACDYEHAADDAAAHGDHDIAWFWRCHKRSLYKKFKDRGEDTDTAILDCFNRMTEMLGVPIGAHDEPPAGSVLVPEDEYDELLAQATASEQIEEYAEETEYRIAQQQNLIDSLQQSAESDQEEIDRLKREAAALRAAQEADEERVEQRQQALQAIYDKRVAQEQEEPPQEEEPPNE